MSNVRSSFWEGVIKLFDFGGYANDHRYFLSDRETDSRAIQSDWQFVGQDIQSAIGLFEEAHSKLLGHARTWD